MPTLDEIRKEWDGAPVATGPDVGFAEAYRESYDAQVSGWGVLSLEYGMLQQEQAQLDRVYELTGQRLAPLGKRPDYFAIAKHYEDGDPLPEHIQQRVKLLDELSAGAAARGGSLAPKVPTYNDMWQATKEKAQKEEREAQFLRAREGGWGRFFGELAGGAIGSMNPESDPLNFFTLGAGGVGKSVAGRILTEGAQQGLIEGINQLTGVQENRRLLGLEYGFDLAMQQIGMTALGAGVIRGGVEGVAAGARRLMPRPDAPGVRVDPETRVTPTARADEMYAENKRFVEETSPYGPEPEAARRFADEVEGVYERSNNWDPTPGDRGTQPEGAPPARVLAEPVVEPERIETTVKTLDQAEAEQPDVFTALQEQRAKPLPPKPGEEPPPPKPKAEGAKTEAAPEPEPKPYIELGGKRYARTTTVLDPDTGKPVTLNDLVDDFDAEDMVLEAAKFCGLRT